MEVNEASVIKDKHRNDCDFELPPGFKGTDVCYI